MIRFACPGCRWQHLSNPAFVGYIARCARCGAQLTIPGESAPEAAGEGKGGATQARPGRPPGPQTAPGGLAVDVKARPPAIEFDDDLSLDYDDELVEEEPLSVRVRGKQPPGQPRPGRPAVGERAPRQTPEPDDDPEPEYGEARAEPEPGESAVLDADPAGREPQTPYARAAKTLATWWADTPKRIAMIAVPAVLLVGVVLLIFTSGDKPKEEPVVTAPPPAPAPAPA
ncbi:MAG: hypothetical protein JWO38_5226, partial [Gemmataceae bacterium]|nr:hypothetical protein [Gemmataceae bacterium]